MTGRKNRALQVPYVVPYKAFRILPRALYGTTIGTYSPRFFLPVMSEHNNKWGNHFVFTKLEC